MAKAPVDKNAHEFGGFTVRQMDRMVKCLKSNRAYIKRRIIRDGMEAMTTAYVMKHIREYK